jgi:hypothetical protein
VHAPLTGGQLGQSSQQLALLAAVALELLLLLSTEITKYPLVSSRSG